MEDDFAVSDDDDDGGDNMVNGRVRRQAMVDAETYKNATGFVIEMAVFVDAHYYARIHKMVPGREQEYIIITFAALHAVYGDREKVGYDVAIKVKLYNEWITDPEGYDFEESIYTNLRSFCTLTTQQYTNYDMHFLHTGVTKQKGPAAGVAYVGNVCHSKNKCVNILGTSPNRIGLMAHEVGHNLGFSHHGTAKCPADIKAQGAGFMGNSPLKFSPCNKWELVNNLFSKGKGKCLFQETGATETEEPNLPKVYQGQYTSQNEQCRGHGGPDYEFYRPFDLTGTSECRLFMCANFNPTSPEYLRILKKKARFAYPCGEEMFCNWGPSCTSWNDTDNIGWDLDYLRSNRRDVTWSEWAAEWSECSSSCGTGVQIKRRQCQIPEGVNLSPHCRGKSVRSRMCNVQPCPDQSASVEEIRRQAGESVCTRFYLNNVTLNVAKGGEYLPRIRNIYVTDGTSNLFDTKSCMLMCDREPIQWNNVDAMYPDGTPCIESSKSALMRTSYNIHLRCVQGVCTEMSDCPHNEEKDACGVCGGAPTRCVVKKIGVDYDVPAGSRSTLATLPAGTQLVDVSMKWWVNRGVRLELWDGDEQVVIGPGGSFRGTKYVGDKEVQYAGTRWSYAYVSFIRAKGPTNRTLVIKALRNDKPIKEIIVMYLLPESS